MLLVFGHIFNQFLKLKKNKIRSVTISHLSFLHSTKGYFVQVSGVFQPPEVLVALSAMEYQKADWLQLLIVLLK